MLVSALIYRALYRENFYDQNGWPLDNGNRKRILGPQSSKDNGLNCVMVAGGV